MNHLSYLGQSNFPWSNIFSLRKNLAVVIPYYVQTFVLACQLLVIFLYMYLLHSVCETTEGESREEIWSSVNYLLFVSTFLIYGKDQHLRQGIVWLKDLKYELELEMSRARCRLKFMIRQRGFLCRELFPAKSCLHICLWKVLHIVEITVGSHWSTKVCFLLSEIKILTAGWWKA